MRILSDSVVITTAVACVWSRTVMPTARIARAMATRAA
jgi:hypothetical protein